MLLFENTHSQASDHSFAVGIVQLALAVRTVAAADTVPAACTASLAGSFVHRIVMVAVVHSIEVDSLQ